MTKLNLIATTIGLATFFSYASLAPSAAGTTQYIETTDGKTVIVRTVGEYAPTGNYLHSDKIRVENRDITFDTKGIPMMNFRWGTHYYPITIAQYGLQHHALYLQSQKQDNYNKLIQAADYFVQTQDDNGGWPTKFNHMFYKGRTEEIKAPWYSAMAQGQAMSLLVRAYNLTRKEKYLETAKKGITIFSIPVEKGGVLRKLEGTYWFYEEYPTQPASYVLNGFMYSILGLYDVHKLTGDEDARKLYLEGVKTLKRTVSFYDLGNRTSYDLTHITTEGNPPNIARWGYHATHILQLSAIYAIEKDEFFKTVLDRWIDYTGGKTAKVN